MKHQANAAAFPLGLIQIPVSHREPVWGSHSGAFGQGQQHGLVVREPGLAAGNLGFNQGFLSSSA